MTNQGIRVNITSHVDILSHGYMTQQEASLVEVLQTSNNSLIARFGVIWPKVKTSQSLEKAREDKKYQEFSMDPKTQ